MKRTRTKAGLPSIERTVSADSDDVVADPDVVVADPDFVVADPDDATTQLLNTNHRLRKIISGGQIGADRAALEAAQTLGIATGGWAPVWFFTARGPDYELRDRFHLKEVAPPDAARKRTVSSLYIERSKLNVDEADGTVAFRLYSSAGTDRTIAYARSGQWGGRKHSTAPHRPSMVISSLDERDRKTHVDALRRFIRMHRIKTLNVCGHREGPPSCPDFADRIKSLLVAALKCFK